jgi:hypothetical protein
VGAWPSDENPALVRARDHLQIHCWGQQITGWSSINIYESVYLERTGQPLKSLRQQDEEAPSGP